MIDHLSLHVNDYNKSKNFYLKALAPLGYEIVMEFEGAAGFGVNGKPDLWVKGDGAGRSSHIAFTAQDRGAVDAFYAAAIAAGGRDNGAPGVRKDYHENYYAAFVFDPDGNNIEVVCHKAV